MPTLVCLCACAPAYMHGSMRVGSRMCMRGYVYVRPRAGVYVPAFRGVFVRMCVFICTCVRAYASRCVCVLVYVWSHISLVNFYLCDAVISVTLPLMYRQHWPPPLLMVCCSCRTVYFGLQINEPFCNYSENQSHVHTMFCDWIGIR